MTRIKSRKNRQVVLTALLIAGFLLAFVLLGRAYNLNKSEWAVWVQAIGSILAIGIAVWVPYYQRKQANDLDVLRSREEARRICLAIRDELQFLQRMFTEGPNVQALLQLGPNEIFDGILPDIVPTERFQIYNSVIGRLTLIADDQLRQDIIYTYEIATGLIYAGMQNNRLLREYRDLEAIVQDNFTPFNSNRHHFHLEALQRSALSMRRLLDMTMSRVSALLPQLDKAVVQDTDSRRA